MLISLIFLLYSIVILSLSWVQIRQLGERQYYLTFLPYFNFVFFLFLGIGGWYVFFNHENILASRKYTIYEVSYLNAIGIYIFHIMLNIGSCGCGALLAIKRKRKRGYYINLHFNKLMFFLLLVLSLVSIFNYKDFHEYRLVSDQLSLVKVGEKGGGSFLFIMYLLPYLLFFHFNRKKQFDFVFGVLFLLTSTLYILELRMALILNLALLLFLCKIFRGDAIDYGKYFKYIVAIIFLVGVVRWYKYFALHDTGVTAMDFASTIIDRIFATPALTTINVFQKFNLDSVYFAQLYGDQLLSIFMGEKVEYIVGHTLFEMTLNLGKNGHIGFDPATLPADFYISFGTVGMIIGGAVFGFVFLLLNLWLNFSRDMGIQSLGMLFVVMLYRVSIGGLYSDIWSIVFLMSFIMGVNLCTKILSRLV